MRMKKIYIYILYANNEIIYKAGSSSNTGLVTLMLVHEHIGIQIQLSAF